jgi:hypothetical protein
MAVQALGRQTKRQLVSQMQASQSRKRQHTVKTMCKKGVPRGVCSAEQAPDTTDSALYTGQY